MNKHLTEVRILLSNRSNQSVDLFSAASLAKTLEVTLKGVFLEEEDLICAAELTISKDISRWSAKEKEISSNSVQQAFRYQARHQQRELKKIAEQQKIKYGFDVVRGERNSWIIDEIKRNGLLFVSHQNVIRNSCNNLNYSFLNKSVVTLTTKAPVKVVFSGSKASKRALKIAVQIAQLSNRPLTVLLESKTFENELNLRKELNKYLEKQTKMKVNAEIFDTQNQAKTLSEELFMLIYPVDINDEAEFPRLLKLLHHLNSSLILVR